METATTATDAPTKLTPFAARCKQLRSLSPTQLRVLFRGHFEWHQRQTTIDVMVRKGLMSRTWEMTPKGRELAATLRRLADDAGDYTADKAIELLGL